MWIQQSAIKANPDKCQLLLSTNQNKLANIQNSLSEELLGISIGTNLKFDVYVNNICKKISQKLNALTRIASHECRQKRVCYESLYQFAF